MTGLKNLDPYGIKWIGLIAEDWSISPVKRHFDIQLGKMLQNDPKADNDCMAPYLKAANVLWGRVNVDDVPEMWASPGEIMSYEVKDGDLLVCEGGEVGRCGIVRNPPDKCIIQNALHRVRARNSSSIGFLMYVLHSVNSSGWFDVLCNKATIAHFTGEKFAELRIPIPRPHEQQAIATFLDRETSRIDELIAKKERQIELLQEKRSALISHAVTKGLDPNLKMKDSGVEWLGEIPEHWEVKKVKNVVLKIGSGKTPKGGSEVYVDSGIMLIRSQNVHFDGLRLDDIAFIEPEIDAEMANTRVIPGDTLLNITGASLGRCCIMPANHDLANVNQHVCIVRPRKDIIDPHFLYFTMCSHPLQSQIFANENGTSREGLNFEQVSNLLIPFPPGIIEQQAIIGKVITNIQKMDINIAKVNRSIDLLREYRTALISAAVTGKIDLREEVPVS